MLSSRQNEQRQSRALNVLQTPKLSILLSIVVVVVVVVAYYGHYYIIIVVITCLLPYYTVHVTNHLLHHITSLQSIYTVSATRHRACLFVRPGISQM